MLNLSVENCLDIEFYGNIYSYNTHINGNKKRGHSKRHGV